MVAVAESVPRVIVLFEPRVIPFLRRKYESSTADSERKKL